MATYVILDKVFKKQTDIKKYVKDILDFRFFEDQGKGQIMFNDEEFKFMEAFFSRHPRWDEKKGKGLSFITYVKNKNKSYDLTIHRIDGTTCTISWNRCIHQNEKTEHAVKVGLYRYKISGQIKDHLSKNSHITKCQICNLDLNGKPEVDHIYPFSLIVRDYEKNKIEGLNFQTYHKMVAKFQILCVKCNREKRDRIVLDSKFKTL